MSGLRANTSILPLITFPPPPLRPPNHPPPPTPALPVDFLETYGSAESSDWVCDNQGEHYIKCMVV